MFVHVENGPSKTGNPSGAAAATIRRKANNRAGSRVARNMRPILRRFFIFAEVIEIRDS